MTEKKKTILNKALGLFAKQGYASTSTAKVAKEARVSEGLIFKHFGNKEGLLQAVLAESIAAAEEALNAVIKAPTPQEKIMRMLELPFEIKASQYEMWRLTYALKWQRDNYDNSFQNAVKVVLQDAFSKLGYLNPAAEAELLFMITDGAATTLLLHKPENPAALLLALKNKYPI
jgi:AcrR family transcriptional regulator